MAELTRIQPLGLLERQQSIDANRRAEYANTRLEDQNVRTQDKYDVEPPEYLSLTSSRVSHSLSSAKSFRRGRSGGLFRGALLPLFLLQFHRQSGIAPLWAFERYLSYQAKPIRTPGLA